ncbi:hypothetical protein N0V93_007707 [Gnomoniopsis smithogilvyi]|uniref:F-box domain-containing protein n=1 Tax=Gnomoniopsis smithogilvyi TaxID=1191159 RepID=A0A9W8YLK4_9PEZI|nr:hypothetical protein N0V93_007707 [Gnomoniopsis smithogilvyi]
MTGIYDLPIELVKVVADYLKAGELAAFAQTSRKFPDLYSMTGTLRKTLAVGIDPDIVFADQCDGTTRNMVALRKRFEALDRENSRDSSAVDNNGEWSPQHDEDEAVGEHLDPSHFEFTDQDIDAFSDDEEDEVGGLRYGVQGSVYHVTTLSLRVFRAIHLAALGGHDEVIQILLDHGVKIDALCRELCDCALTSPRALGKDAPDHRDLPAYWAKTALHLAICHFQKSTARLLLARGASIWLSDPKRPTTAFHSAAATGQTDLCQRLLDCGYVHDVDILDSKKLSPFYCAYFNGHWDTTVPFLLEKGANIDIQIPRNRDSVISAGLTHSCTILYEAIEQGRFEDAIRLVHLGANVNKGSFIDVEPEKTPLHAASRPSNKKFRESPRNLPLKFSSAVQEEHLRTRLVQVLIQAGSEIDARTLSEDGTRGLQREELHEMLAFSIQYRSEAFEAFDLLYDLDSGGSLWESSAHVMQMIKSGHLQLAWTYLQRKLPPLSPSEKSVIFHGAIQDCSVDILRLMLAIKVPVDLPDQDGDTPLYMLLNSKMYPESNLCALVQDFLAAGADPHYVNDSNSEPTPIQSAIGLDLASVVEIMLHHSPVRSNTRARKGAYLHTAARNSRPSKQIISMLLQAGAELTELDVNGDTPLAVFLEKMVDESYLWIRILPGQGDVHCETIWHLWSQDVDIMHKNRAGKSILSYLAALRSSSGRDGRRALVAEALQRRIRIVPLPGDKNGKTLEFSPWFARLDPAAAKKSRSYQSCD